MLRIVFRNRHRNLSKAEGLGSGPQGRINRMRRMVSDLIRDERIEGWQFYLDESRGYAERLIQEAMKYGDNHQPTMDMVDYWLLEKDLIPKLYKVLCPRYSNWETSFTRMYRLPTEYPGDGKPRAVLELKGNPYPPVVTNHYDNSKTLLNMLLDGARKEYKYKNKISDRELEREMAEQLDRHAAIESDKSGPYMDTVDKTIINNLNDTKDIRSNTNMQGLDQGSSVDGKNF